MSASRIALVSMVLALALATGACQTTKQPELILSKKGAVELRAMQSRMFETDDEIGTLRTIIATLQDLGYTVEKVEPAAGTVSAMKLIHLRLTATAFPRGTNHMIVRANAIVDMLDKRTQVDSPEFYQKFFFEPLSKAMFLTALQVEDTDTPPEPAIETSDKHGATP